jgi:hypothetical protein
LESTGYESKWIRSTEFLIRGHKMATRNVCGLDRPLMHWPDAGRETLDPKDSPFGKGSQAALDGVAQSLSAGFLTRLREPKLAVSGELREQTTENNW